MRRSAGDMYNLNMKLNFDFFEWYFQLISSHIEDLFIRSILIIFFQVNSFYTTLLYLFIDCLLKGFFANANCLTTRYCALVNASVIRSSSSTFKSNTKNKYCHVALRWQGWRNAWRMLPQLFNPYNLSLV